MYAIEEIVAEKLRSLLQQATRHPRARDYYDLWQLLVRRDIRLDEAAPQDPFRAKCKYKRVPFDSPAQFFLPYLLEECRDDWTKSVGRQVRLEHAFDDVIAELKPAVERLFGQGGQAEDPPSPPPSS